MSSLGQQQRWQHQGAAVRDAEGPSQQATINTQALCTCWSANELQTAYSDTAADTATSLDLPMGQLLKALRSQTHELSSYLASGGALVEVAMMAHVKHQINTSGAYAHRMPCVRLLLLWGEERARGRILNSGKD